MINLKPKICNLCGGQVTYTSNGNIYGGRIYGSGYCYLCINCGAYVGTHKPMPKVALGLLANEEMRKWKIDCHHLFDWLWKSGEMTRKKAYNWLSRQMNLRPQDCHFGHFTLEQLKVAHQILKDKMEGK